MSMLIVSDLYWVGKVLGSYLYKIFAGPRPTVTADVAQFKKLHPEQRPDMVLVIRRWRLHTEHKLWQELEQITGFYP